MLLFGVLPLITVGVAAAFVFHRLMDYPPRNSHEGGSQTADVSKQEMSEADQKSAKKLIAAFLGVFMLIMTKANYQAIDHVLRTKFNTPYSDWPLWLALPLAFLEMCLLLIVGRFWWSFLG